MGCLFFPLELLVDGIIEGWFYLMGLIIPKEYMTSSFRFIIKIVVFVFSCILFVVMLLGIFAIISDDKDIKLIGRYMIFIPLLISAVQILIGVIVRIFLKKKNKR